MTFICVSGGTRPARAVAAAPAESAALTKEEQGRVLDGVLAKLDESYVFPETAKKMAEAVRGRAAKGEYDAVADPQAFAHKLTEDLRAVSNDKHLSVFYSPRDLPGDLDETAFDTPLPPVEVLPGNVGYLDLRGFAPTDPEATASCAAALSFLSNTDALILDLRQNGGGEPDMVRLVCSYLFDAGEEVHLNDIYWRPDGKTRTFRTLPKVDGRRYGRGRLVYVLTSGRTFSGAEECAYNLQTQKRATIVGETTGGGAHPGGARRVTDHFGVWVPMGRAINPVTGKNWEGTGVAPDVNVPAADALRTAQRMALEKLLPTVQGDERRGAALKRALADVSAVPAVAK
jgi:hypothetical protein